MIQLAECMARAEKRDYVVYKKNSVYDFMTLIEAEQMKLNYIYVTKVL